MTMIDCEFLGKVVPLLLRHQVEVQGLWQAHAKGLLLRWEAGELVSQANNFVNSVHISCYKTMSVIKLPVLATPPLIM